MKSLLTIKGHMVQWYRSNKRKTGPQNKILTEPHDLTLSMIGSKTNQCLSLKGAESWSFFFIFFAPSFIKNIFVSLF